MEIHMVTTDIQLLNCSEIIFKDEEEDDEYDEDDYGFNMIILIEANKYTIYDCFCDKHSSDISCYGCGGDYFISFELTYNERTNILYIEYDVSNMTLDDNEYFTLFMKELHNSKEKIRESFNSHYITLTPN